MYDSARRCIPWARRSDDVGRLNEEARLAATDASTTTLHSTPRHRPRPQPTTHHPLLFDATLLDEMNRTAHI